MGYEPLWCYFYCDWGASASVNSQLDHCNSLLYSIKKANITKFQNVEIHCHIMNKFENLRIGVAFFDHSYDLGAGPFSSPCFPKLLQSGHYMQIRAAVWTFVTGWTQNDWFTQEAHSTKFIVFTMGLGPFFCGNPATKGTSPTKQNAFTFEHLVHLKNCMHMVKSPA